MTLYQKTLDDFQENFVGYAGLVIIGQSCFGGAAVMYILENGLGVLQLFQMALVLLSCTMLNVCILSLQTPKLVLKFTIFSVVLSALMILLNALMIYLR